MFILNPSLLNNHPPFRVISLSIHNHNILGTCDFTFQNDPGDNDVNNAFYTTVIIGANGIGKSYLLRVIVDIFNYIHDINHSDKTPQSLGYSFKITYLCRGHVYDIDSTPTVNVHSNTRLTEKITCLRDSKSIGLHMCELPNVVIASAMTVSDKFVIRGENKSNAMYFYKGIRNEKSPSTTGTRTLIRNTVNGLIKCLSHKGGFRDELSLLLKVLNLKPTLKIRYKLRYINALATHAEELSPQLLKDFFDRKNGFLIKRESDLWGKRNFDKIRNDTTKLEQICNFYRRVISDPITHANKWNITYDIFDQFIEQDADILQTLSNIDLLSFPTLLIEKDEVYDFAESSSGETQLLCQMIGIMSEIKQGGLVLIDEPETSSHPNWQINYYGWLRKIFAKYDTCHFIISTHSHFLLTDLEPKTSSIIALRRDDGQLKNMDENLNTFCWSTDDILYRIFHVRNTRNYVFEQKIADLYNKISYGCNDFNSINSLINELSSYQLNADDPLRRLILNAQKYVESCQSR